jgi:DNA-binding NtrC family response regulator
VGLSLEEMERRLIEATLEHYGGHRANSAKALGIGVRTLTGKLRQYGYAPREKSFSKSSRNAS